MNEEWIGCFAVSLAGHDKCTIYVIIGADAEYVYLSDGKNKTIEHPKKKKIKHIQLIKRKDSEIAKKQQGHVDVRNEDIKRAIKIYISNE